MNAQHRGNIGNARVSAPCRPAAWLGVLIVAVVSVTTASAQTRMQQYFGPSYGWQFGRGLGMAGDVDFDGTNDIILGAGSQGKVAIHSGRTGALIHSFISVGGGFGYEVDGAGDVNADGIPDVIISGPLFSPGGVVWAFSTQSTSPLHTTMGVASGHYGDRLRFAGDADGDGHSDYLVGDQGAVPPAPPITVGGVFMISGATALPLQVVYGDGLDFAGYALDSAGDVDGDGWTDILMGVNIGVGYAKLCSGRTGAQIYKFLMPSSDSGGFGRAVANAGDINADGVPDSIVSDMLYPYTDGTGRVHVFSGATGELLMTGAGDKPFAYLGFSVLGPGDLDGDGYDDVVAGNFGGLQFPFGSPQDNYIRAWSGQTHLVLFDKGGFAGVDGYTYNGFGYELAAAGDLNDDGTPDIVSTSLNGFVTVLSGKPLPLEPNNTLMTVSGGGAQQLRFHAGMEFGGDVYLLAGTTSGTTPGLQVGNALVPLNLDAYTSFTVSSPNTAPLSGSLGVLSSSGKSFSQFVLPPFSPQSLAGITAHHVAITLDANGIGKISNPVLVTLAP